MELLHEVSAIEIVNQLHYKPNGREYACKLCLKIEFSLQNIQKHVLEHKIGDIF